MLGQASLDVRIKHLQGQALWLRHHPWRQGRRPDVFAHKTLPLPVDQNPPQGRNAHAQARAPARVGMALPLKAIHAPQLTTPIKTQGDGTAIGVGRTVVKRPMHGGDVLRHPCRVGAKTSPCEQHMRRPHALVFNLQHKTLGATLRGRRIRVQGDQGMGANLLAKPMVQCRAASGQGAVKATLAVPC